MGVFSRFPGHSRPGLIEAWPRGRLARLDSHVLRNQGVAPPVGKTRKQYLCKKRNLRLPARNSANASSGSSSARTLLIREALKQGRRVDNGKGRVGAVQKICIPEDDQFGVTDHRAPDECTLRPDEPHFLLEYYCSSRDHLISKRP